MKNWHLQLNINKINEKRIFLIIHALGNNFRATKKFLIAKFECTFIRSSWTICLLRAESHFGRDTLARMTLWPVTLWPETLWPVTLWSEWQLARVRLWPVFLASFGVPKGEQKFHVGDHWKKFEKNNHHFSKKIRVNFFFKFFPMVPHHGIFIHPLVPQRKQEKLAKLSLWPKCHWPNCHSGQNVTGQSVTSQSDTGQIVTLAKVSRPKCRWPKCLSGQSVIQPFSWIGWNLNVSLKYVVGLSSFHVFMIHLK